MTDTIFSFFSAFWLIFSFSFLVALTGAIVPGPLLTYTIFKSTETHQRGYLMGIWIIIGHALIEMVIVVFLLLGFSFVLKNMVVVRSIGITGGLILFYLGFSIIRDVKQGKVQSGFLDIPDTEKLTEQEKTRSPHEPAQTSHGQQNTVVSWGRRIMKNPVTGGMVVSMSNPYWWVWWATIGFAFMVQFEVSLNQWPKLLAFFLGHEAGDMIWYVIVSFLSFFGIRHLNKKAYRGILIFCGCFMTGFGIYLAIMPLTFILQP